jgi:prolyl oligopeptidase
MKFASVAWTLPLLAALVVIGPSCSKDAGKSSENHLVAARKAVTNAYHGTTVVDDYQWLENAADPAVKKWSAAQNAQARGYLDKLETRPLLQDRLTRLVAKTSPNYSSLAWRAGKLFLMKFQPPAQQPVLITLDSPTNLASEKVVLDLNKLSASGAVSIDWFVPSPDGKLVAVCLSENGSEDGTLHFYNSETGAALPDKLPRAQYPTGGGSAAWTADSTGIFYTRYPAKGERPEADAHFFQQIYFHKLGTPTEQDTYEYGKEFPRIGAIELESSMDGKHLLASVANGDGGEFAHYLRNARGEWKQIARHEDQVKHVEFGRDPLYIEYGRDDSLYLLSTKDAPRGKILRMKLSAPDLATAKVAIAPTTNTIADFKPTASGIALVYLRGGPMQFVYHDFLNDQLSGPSSRSDRPSFRTPTSVGQMLVTRGDEVLFRAETYTAPFTWWKFDANKSRDNAEATALKGTSPASFDDIEAVRVTVKSKDGTSVPMTLIKREGTRLTGDNPTLLYGYGGYGISLTPRFDATRRVWFDQGGVLAIANLRGGGEFGEKWHLSGNLTNKQNVFDDFAACAEWLVKSNYTKPEKLAVQGGSNGGLLMGAMLTQHPNAMKAVVAQVGIFDMLRVELDPNGEFNTTEFGTVKNAEHFRALHAYSPYHRVQDSNAYPAVLLMTGEHDGRVNPAHSRKMTARLAAASKQPVLLRTSSTSGHGQGTSLNERVEQLADVYSFLMDQLGVDYTLVERGPLSGGVTPTSAVVKGKVAREGMSVRLAVSQNALLTSPTFTPKVTSDTNHNNVVAFEAKNLTPDTQYYYALEIDGRLDRKTRGMFKTFPAPGSASFTFAFASCGRTGSTRNIFDRIREHQPLFYMNMGDFHYQDINTNRPELFRAAYDAVLASPQQADLYRSTPLVYMWDDHDYAGNNSSKRSKSHIAARSVYDEYVPHYPFHDPALDGPINHSFSVGRVKFIITDLRSERDEPRVRDDAKKSLMGVEQKQWFKDELLAANGKYPLIFWMTSVPFIGERGKSPYATLKTNVYGYIHHTQSNLFNVRTNRSGRNSGSNTNAPGGNNNPNGGGGDEDHWSAFSFERREIADFIKSNKISGVAILHGDSHMMAADDGSNADYATGGGAPIPVMCGGPLDQNPSLKGGPYSEGVYRVRDREGESGFGLIHVRDRGNEIEVDYTGRNNTNKVTVSLKFAVPVKSTGP